MLNKRHSLETTKLDFVDVEQPAIIPATNSYDANTFELSAQKLQENYDALIEGRAIYFPVAYRLVEELGRGRQGIVFRAERQGARGCVTQHAIKIFDPGIYPSVQRYWTDMGRIAAQISALQGTISPNLVARDVYEESNGIGYIQMELVHGWNLFDLLRGDHLEKVKGICTKSEWLRFTDVIFRIEGERISIQPGVALHIMREILRGLETLHEKGFVHSDIKPANIMISRLGYVRLVDYGRAVRANEKMTLLLGSPLYMSPETHRREPSLIQSDLYSIGLVGIEMLRGEPILDATNMTEQDILNFKMNLHHNLNDLLPEHVRKNTLFVQLIRRFIQPDPGDRYATTEEAEVGSEGLSIVHRQLVHLGKDSEYGRELQRYMAKLLELKIRHQELPSSKRSDK